MDTEAVIEKIKRVERGLYKRGDVWYIDVTYRDPTSGVKRRHREPVGPNKELARDSLSKIRTQIKEKKFFPDLKDTVRIKFRDFTQEYFKRYARVYNRSHHDVENKLSKLNEYFGDKYLHEITRETIENYRAERIKEIRGSTLNRYSALLRSCFYKAIEWKKIHGENPASRLRKFPENPRLKFLSTEELEKLYSECGGELLAFVKFAVNTGMRRGEILALTWTDVDIKTGWIYIRMSKSGKQREVPMNQTIKEVLLSLKKLPDRPNIFASHHRELFEAAVKRAGLNIEGVTLHTLRHTFASHLVMSGVDLKTVAELLGHSRVAMTERYAHLSQSHKNRAVEILNSKLGQKNQQGQSHDTTTPQNEISKTELDKSNIITHILSVA